MSKKKALNISDLAAHLGAAGNDSSSISKRLYRDTRCGISFYAERTGKEVAVAGYAEGSGDAECKPIVLQYPIDLDEFDRAVAQADQEGCDLFDEFHCSRCGIDLDPADDCPDCEEEETS